MANENLGAAERIIQAVTTYADHLFHGRPGIVTVDRASAVGVKWSPVTHKVEGTETVVYRQDKVGSRTNRVRIGVRAADGTVRNGNTVVGSYREAGVFPEVATWMYRQVADVYALDNEFAARWASYAFAQEHRDLKVILAAFMLVQARKGDPVRDAGQVIFHDEDYRDVGEAMLLLQRKDGRDFNAKMLTRVWDVLHVQGVADINRQLGFTSSAKNPAIGRLTKAIEKWLRHREQNPRLLEGLVKAGFRTTVMGLAQRVHYKPLTQDFFKILRWKQKQAEDGRRTIAIGLDVAPADSWEGLSEAQVCERIVGTKPNWKRIVGMLPSSVGITRAILCAAVEAGSLSNQDLIILTPTLEDLGLTKVSPVKEAWEKAIAQAENQRAANIALRVRSQDTKEKLAQAVDNANAKAMAEVTRGLRLYLLVDISGSMTNAIAEAKTFITKMLGGFPLDKLHVATFNTTGRVVKINHASQAGVNHAFQGITANGGTSHGSGIRALAEFKPAPEEDALIFVVGDEGETGTFDREIQASGINPVGMGLLKVSGHDRDRIVRETANRLGIPCMTLDTKMFEDQAYSITRIFRNLLASTPVGITSNVPKARSSLVETILKTDLLAPPAWA